MLNPNDIVIGKQKFYHKVMAVGGGGVGKTRFGATFPKGYHMITEPGGQDTWLTVPELRANIVGYDMFIPIDEADTKRIFTELDSACIKAKEMALKGEIESVVLDNFTYLAENRWIYINKYEQEISPRTGEVDIRAMYGKLSRWLYNFTLMKLVSLPCNVVLTVHEKMEADEVMEKKPDKTIPIVPSILGGFRDDAGGLVSLVLYLAKIRIDNNKYKYLARTNLGQGKNAKSRYPNLPEIIENISFATLDKTVKDSIGMK